MRTEEPADDPGEPAFNSFAESDMNSDGRIDEAEAENAGILAFAKADLNGDGWLDEQEYQDASDQVLPSAPAQ